MQWHEVLSTWQLPSSVYLKLNDSMRKLIFNRGLNLKASSSFSISDSAKFYFAKQTHSKMTPASIIKISSSCFVYRSNRCILATLLPCREGFDHPMDRHVLGDTEGLLTTTATNLHLFLWGCFFGLILKNSQLKFIPRKFSHVYNCIHQTCIKLTPSNQYAHSDHGSRCFTISRVLKGLKAVSAHAIRSSKAAPGSLGESFSKVQFFGKKYGGNSAAIGHFPRHPKMWREKWTKSG